MITKSIFNNQENLLIFNQTAKDLADTYMPFALADLLTHQVARKQQAMLHFWEAEQTVILGMQDTRVTDLQKGLEVFQHHGYRYLARNSGGLAVVADQGILNFSLFIPLAENQTLSIVAAYQVMTEIIQTALNQFNVEVIAQEVADSYCPGDYDLSIAGQKFAGIAQRRIGNGIAVMIYLSVNGPQAARGEMIKEFYEASLGEAFGQGKFPPVRPSSMANLSELLETDLSVAEVKALITTVFTNDLGLNLTEKNIPEYLLQPELKMEYDRHLTKMIQRNETIRETGGQAS